jgi:uncharacterized membrane protein
MTQGMNRDTVKRYFIMLFVFSVMDAIWLGLIAQPFYQAQIGFLLAKKANWAAAGVFYPLYVTGLVFFMVESALRTRARQGEPRGAGPSSAWWPMPPTA